jgi:carbohydrate diacid regulator
MMLNLDRHVGIMDKSTEILASTKPEEIGKIRNFVDADVVIASDVLKREGFTYRSFGSKITGYYLIYVSGEDIVAVRYSAMIAASLEPSVRFYTEKHDRSLFVKDVILENILPGDVMIKIRGLRIKEKAYRVCILIKYEPRDNVYVQEFVRNIFPDSSKDFVIGIDDRIVAVVKEITPNFDKNDLEKLAETVVTTLADEHCIKCIAGVGSMVNDFKQIPASYRGARIALEVSKVFGNGKSVALYNKLGIVRLIYQLPTTICKNFLEEIFERGFVGIIDDELMFTISKFFENNLNVSETSRKLFIHRNTLVYRIEKIKRLTGLDLREFEDAIVFEVALMVNKYLNENPIKY